MREIVNTKVRREKRKAKTKIRYDHTRKKQKNSKNRYDQTRKKRKAKIDKLRKEKREENQG